MENEPSPPLPEQDLLYKIDAFLEATRMTASEFGVQAVKDAKLVSDLRNGRELRRATRERVVAYMLEVYDKLSMLLSDGSDTDPKKGGQRLQPKLSYAASNASSGCSSSGLDGVPATEEAA